MWEGQTETLQNIGEKRYDRIDTQQARGIWGMLSQEFVFFFNQRSFRVHFQANVSFLMLTGTTNPALQELVPSFCR